MHQRPFRAGLFRRREQWQLAEHVAERQGIPRKVFGDAKANHLGNLRQLVDDFPAAGEVPLLVNPFRFASSESNAATPPPELGQHTEDILTELGLDREQIACLRKKNVV